MYFFKEKIKNNNKGFTLIELIVSMALFTTVSLIGIGSLLTILEASRKTQSLKSVVNNINFGLESMSKTLRVGSNYHCNTAVATPPPPGFEFTQDCAGGGNFIAFEKSGGNPGTIADQIIYGINGTTVVRSVNGGTTFLPLTAPEVEVTSLRFYVFGANAADNLHPRIVIIVRGNVNLGKNAVTEFNIQTSVSKRGLDS